MESGKMLLCRIFFIFVANSYSVLRMKRLFKSFGFALQGIASALQSEMNLRIHLLVSFGVVVFGIALDISLYEWMLCLLCMMVVIALELFNTAIERVVDLLSPEKQPLARVAKDAAAGAVFWAALLSFVIGVLIFLPKIIDMLFP